MDNTVDYGRIVVSLMLAIAVLGISIAMIVFIQKDDRGINAIAKAQEMQQLEALNELDGVIMSGAAVSTTILENSNKFMGFKVNTTKYYYDYTTAGEYYELDTRVYHNAPIKIDPTNVYKANIKHNQNGVPIYIVFEEQTGV